MKKFAIVIAAIALIGTPAFAADMGVPPAPPPAPVYNWTGWYVGVNAGASFGSVKTDFNAADSTVTTTVNGFLTFHAPGFSGSNREYPDGFMGGGQIGYNWQYSPLIVVGLEADFQGALEKDSNTLSSNFTVPALVTGTAVTNYSTKIEWFGTVRGRIGYVWGNGEVMSYLTGGLAYGKVDIEGTSTVSGTINPPGLTFSNTRGIGHSQVNTGWVVGYGTEGKLLIPGWTWKVEGLWMDLGTLDDNDISCVVACKVTGVTGGQVITHTHFTDGILRAGLNYKFY